MKAKVILAILIVLSMLITSVGLAADGTGSLPIDYGAMFRRNVSKTPEQETERAGLNHMSFYVPAQTAAGVVEPIEYIDAEGALVDIRTYARPLVAVYIDELEHEEELGSGGAGMGAHDAYAAHSLDDGDSWKRTNLSNSADLSSFTLHDGMPFPGDAHNMTFAIAGDRVMVGWISRYCDGGSPLYTFTEEEILNLQEDVSYGEYYRLGSPDLYVRDIWGVAGTQKSVDFTLQGFPEVGEIPYSCVWAARGQLLPVELDDGSSGYDIIWTKAERLTSGRRDANRLEMNADGAAGFMMTWQEDPDGLRPGQGLGPGEGWSGAVVNQQTDLWYSFISIEDFDYVDSDGDPATFEAIPLTEYAEDSMPKVAFPMAMPIRLTDNAKCMFNGTSNPYCYVDFDDENPWLTVLPDTLDWEAEGGVVIDRTDQSTFCTTSALWLPPGQEDPNAAIELCEAEDGRVLGGRVGASRPRVNVQPYNSLYIADLDDIWYDSAIVIMGAEESKALGEGSTEDDVEPADIGKNMWYYSFDLRNPEFVMQGGMLNQPARCNPYDAAAGDCTLNEFYPLLEDDFENPFYETEIARRFSHFSQPAHQFGDSGISAVLIVKQGILNQGGPADIFLRMTQVDDTDWATCDLDGDGTAEEKCPPAGYNPYAYENLVCGEATVDGEVQTGGWVYDGEDEDGKPENPRYVEGLCLDNMINVSGTSIEACNDESPSGEDCAANFPWESGTTTFAKVTVWSQCGPDHDGTFTACAEEENTLDDQSWENPYDVSKGHRGFIDGDFIMMMYAWSPNWKANSVGNDHYNLYARRSFDGGKTWTTLPDDSYESSVAVPDSVEVVADGSYICENYQDDSVGDAGTVCLTYESGKFEPSRNLSQLTGNRETILDPRYSPTGGIKMLPVTDKLLLDDGGETLPYDDDLYRDPSKFFIVYETGDNTTVAEGEAVPMDLFYSRAINWGDDYNLAEKEVDGELEYGFDWLEHDREDLSGEAGNTANNAGTFYYAIWNQWNEDEHENVSNSDAIFRRTTWLENTTTDAMPSATILYASTDRAAYDDEDIVLIGSGKDNDSLGEGDEISNVQWQDDLTGQTFNERTWKFPPRGLIPGHHSFSFQAQDNEGNWSNPKTVTIWIAEQFYDTYLPLVTR